METHQVAAPAAGGELRDRLPGHAVHLAGEPELVAAWCQEVAERRAQAAKVESLLSYKARKLEQNQGQHVFTRRAAQKAVTRDAATVLGLTEAAVRRLLGTAEFLTEKLPKTWRSYRSGLIDRERAVKVAQAVEDIAHREDLLPVIDAEIAARAPAENAGAVQKWVTRRVQELDTQSFQELYDRAQAKRYVNFHHLGNGMSRIDALIPTLVAAQIEQQTYAQARNAPRSLSQSRAGDPIPGDRAEGTVMAEGFSSQQPRAEERTLTQRIADAFINRLQAGSPADTGGAGPDPVMGEGHVPAAGGPAPIAPGPLKIGVLVSVETLVGESDAPAISWDRSWSLPAGTARQISLDPTAEHDWYIAGATTPGNIVSTGQEPPTGATPEILTVVHPRTGPRGTSLRGWISGADPVEDNLLTRAYRSRTARDRQRDAVVIRDGQCTRPGCTNPGWEAEIDHTWSYETGGQTTGENLRVLCRDCHSIKSHRLDKPPATTGRKTHQAPGPNRTPQSAATRESTRTSPARASPRDEDLPEWLIETRPPPDWAAPDAA